MTIRTRRIRLGALVLLSLLLLAAAQLATAQTKSFSWDEWDVTIELLETGELAVTERQSLDFRGSPFTFGFRTIPTGSLGLNDGIRDVRVREGDAIYTESSSNQPGTFEVTERGNETAIDWYFPPSLGPHTYEFSYSVDGAVRLGSPEQGSGDQIFWTTIPSDHPATIRNHRTTIILPEGVAPQQYTGTTDYLVAAYINGVETNDVAIEVTDDGRVITYELLRPLVAGEELAIRVQFPHGLLPLETSGWQQQEQTGDILGLIMLALSLLLMVGGPLGVVLLWYTRGRDPEIGIVVPEYITEPPSDLPPAMVGTLIDEKADMQDVVSTMADLGHRGYLVMQEEKDDFLMQRTDKSDEALRQYEKTFLRKLFGRKDERYLDDLKFKFADSLPQLKNEIYDELVSEGLVPRSPQTVRTSYTVLAVGVGVLGVMATIGIGMVFEQLSAFACLPILAVIATSVTLLIASRHMPVKTAKGVAETAKWEAFRQYLKNIEEYRGTEQVDAKFEEYLGYAIAFGMERSYIQTYAQRPETPAPTWYFPVYPVYGPLLTGSGGGSPRPTTGGGTGSMPRPSLETMSGNLTGGLAGMSTGLTQMLNSANTVLQSTPPPKSGGSGGGYSGGFSGGFSGGSSGGGGSAGFG